VVVEQAQLMWKCGQVECLSASWPLRNALGMRVWAHQEGLVVVVTVGVAEESK
jgi:hypothetical protein